MKTENKIRSLAATAALLWGAAASPADSLSTIEVTGQSGGPSKKGQEFSGAYQEKPKEVSLGRALERRAGVSRSLVTAAEGSEPQFMVRGLAPLQQRFFLEGVPLTDSAFDQSQLSWIPQESISGVDFFPDGVPLALGADGLGSAFQLKWRAFSVCENDLTVKGGSFGYARLGAQACLDKRNQVAARVAVSRSDEGFRYLDDHGLPLSPELHTWETRRENGFNEITAAPSFSLAEGRVRGLSLNRWLNKKVPGPISAPRFGTLNEHSHALLLFWDPAPQAINTSLAVKWDDTAMQFADQNYISPVPSRTEILSAGTKGSFAFSALGKSDARFTAGGTLEMLQSEDTRRGPLNSSRWDVPVGLGAKWDLLGISVFPAVQAHAYGFQTDRAAKLEWSPRLGVEVPWSRGVKSRLTVGQFYRLPNLTERFGSANGLVPSATLKSEKAFKASLANEVAVARGWRGSFEVAAIRAADLIAYETTGPQAQVARNLESATVWYGGLAAEADLPLDFIVRTGLEWLASQNQEAGVNYGKELPFRPQFRFRPSLLHESDGWSLSYDVEYTGAQFWDVANLKRSEGFWQHNFRVSHRHRSWGTFSLELLNLSDVTQVATQIGTFSNTDFSTGYQGFPAPGRRGYFSWSYAF